RIEELSGRRRLPALTGANWSVALDGYDFLAVRFSAPNVRIAQAQVTVDPGLATSLNSRVSELQQRIASLANKLPFEGPVNSSFELPAKGAQIPGWSLANTQAGAIVLEDDAAN